SHPGAYRRQPRHKPLLYHTGAVCGGGDRVWIWGQKELSKQSSSKAGALAHRKATAGLLYANVVFFQFRGARIPESCIADAENQPAVLFIKKLKKNDDSKSQQPRIERVHRARRQHTTLPGHLPAGGRPWIKENRDRILRAVTRRMPGIAH